MSSATYPVWWDTDLTIYNKYEDPQTRVITWYRSEVEDAFWKDNATKVQIGDTIIQSNDIICRIRKSDNFLEKYSWLELPNDEMPNYFTLGSGDLIVKGHVTDEINEYVSGKRSTDFIKKYKALQGCMEIHKVTMNVGAGRCNEHYYVIGE